jgi:hypothetical protein
VLEIDPTFNARHSNSEGLPEIENCENSQQPGKMTAKDIDHLDFLNQLRKNLNVDQAKIINLEFRMSGK